LTVPQEVETELHDELESIRARIDADRPGPVELDAETEAAQRAREPLGPATRQAPEPGSGVDDVDAEELVLDAHAREVPFEKAQLAEQAAMPMADRLVLASSWTGWPGRSPAWRPRRCAMARAAGAGRRSAAGGA
jgi:hypothetical protein